MEWFLGVGFFLVYEISDIAVGVHYSTFIDMLRVVIPAIWNSFDWGGTHREGSVNSIPENQIVGLILFSLILGNLGIE